MLFNSIDQNKYSWEDVNSNYWNELIPTELGYDKTNVAFERIQINDSRYEELIKLRHRGFIRSGFLPKDHKDYSIMAMERDKDSLIIGAIENQKLVTSITINRNTEQYHGLPIYLEKGVEIPCEYSRSFKAVEYSKFVNESNNRYLSFIFVLANYLMYVLDKEYIYSAGINESSAIKFRIKCGFNILENGEFSDRTYGGISSLLYSFQISKLNSQNNLSLVFREYINMLNLNIARKVVKY